ncbi:MAG TPA: serine/threonine-protein kinase [Gemmataceae bacterium]|nr:serine/threonine-protein kinase [Gemmataceae bacterium]
MPDAPENGSASSPPQPAADLTGRAVGDFQILRRLGVGGMGQVYLARQLSLKRDVALKFLRNDMTTNPTALKRFEAEAQAVARLNHPNIVQVYWIGEADGLRYMALEYVEGRNLRDHLARKGPPDLPVALSVMRQVASALQRAHEYGIVHRDIKPENILVTRKVEVKVTDFGLSRYFAGEEMLNLTQSGVTLGTPLYLSPEQAQGKAVDHRSDIYSFGVTCYHLLAGEPPFRGTTAVEVALKHVTDQPKPLVELRPDLPADLCGMVHKMMAKAPDDRYQSAREVLRDLAKVREGLNLGLNPVVTLTVSDPGRSTPPTATALSGTSRVALTQSHVPPSAQPVRWGRWVLAGLACVLAAAGGVVAFAMTNPPPGSVPNPGTTPQNPAPTPSPGVPDIRPSEKLTTTRERELLAAIKDSDTKPDKVIEAYIELGLLQIREHRLPEAKLTFEKLSAKKLDGPNSLHTLMAERAGKLGQAVVLAHQDEPKKSIDLFESVLRTPVPKLGPVKGDKAERDGTRIVQALLLQHPELAQAVSEALNRVVANGSKLSPLLEALRSPRGVSRKE